MIRLISTYFCVFLTVFLVSCSKDSNYYADNNIESAYLLQEQLPSRSFDESSNGLYVGAVLSASTSARGKIWVNIANNGLYNALIEMTTGETYAFEVQAELVTPTTTTTVFNFIGDAGTFTIDVTNFENPEVSELTINNEAFYTHLVKSLSFSPASVATASFAEYGGTNFNGTWSFIADGSLVNPNGDNGDGITSVMIVYNGEAFTDTTMETFNSDNCLGGLNYVPTLNGFGVTGNVIADYQNSEFAGGITKWDLSYDASTGIYMNYRQCTSATSGLFSWTSGDGLTYLVGEIILD